MRIIYIAHLYLYIWLGSAWPPHDPVLINYTEAFKADYSDSNHQGVLLVIKQCYSSHRHETGLGVSNDSSGQAFGQSGKEAKKKEVAVGGNFTRLYNVRRTLKTLSVCKLTQGAIHQGFFFFFFFFRRRYSASSKSGMASCDNLSAVTNDRCWALWGEMSLRPLGHVNRP